MCMCVFVYVVSAEVRRGHQTPGGRVTGYEQSEVGAGNGIWSCIRASSVSIAEESLQLLLFSPLALG